MAIFWWTPTGFMLGTRNLFAWSFDRLAPARLTDVSDRFHTPVIATVTIALVVELLNYLNIYQGLGAYLLNIVAVMGLAFIVVSIAAAAVPWTRPAMHEDAPGWAARRVLGFPVITVVAAMLKAFTAPVIAAVWYIGVSLYRRSQGIALANTFREIPPE
jgi:amino acid transporter